MCHTNISISRLHVGFNGETAKLKLNETEERRLERRKREWRMEIMEDECRKEKTGKKGG